MRFLWNLSKIYFDMLSDSLYDAKVHYSMVLIGFGAAFEDGKLPLDPVNSFDLSRLREHPAHPFSCFFIVQHTDDKEFIEKLARRLLLAGCRNFDFHGEKEPVWHFGIDAVDTALYPDSTSENVALTSGLSTLDQFVEALDQAIAESQIAHHDIYLFYDDPIIYEEVLHKLDQPEDSGSADS